MSASGHHWRPANRSRPGVRFMKTIAPTATTATPNTRRGSGGSLRRLIASSSGHVEQRAQRDGTADQDQHQRPRVAVGHAERVQLHELQPRAHGDQPQALPERAQAEQLGDADQHDEHRPPVADDAAEVAGEEGDADSDENQAGEERVGIDFAAQNFGHDFLRFTSTPAMTAVPRTTSRCCGAPLEATLTSNPAMNGTSSPTISNVSGTKISTPPHMVKMSITAGSWVSLASVRSSWQPPMTAAIRAPANSCGASLCVVKTATMLRLSPDGSSNPKAP